jgi:hypothetical protein
MVVVGCLSVFECEETIDKTLLSIRETKIVGISLVDEGVLGTAHMGVGQNLTCCGKIELLAKDRI